MESAVRNIGSRVLGYLRAHPLLCLVLLTPGIPEYLSGSSPWSVLVANPGAFFLFVALNIGLYGSGVILIREATIQWRKGWASVFLLGFAYGIVEEGLALSTLFNPKAGPVGILGVYGHWLGVSWVWTVGLLLFHSAISIALPIFLFRLAFPSLKQTCLVSNRRAILWVGVLFSDSLVLFFALNYWAGWPIILSSFFAVLLFILAARVVPSNLLRTTRTLPTRRPLTFAILGALFFPASVLIGGVAAGTNAPPLIPIVLEVILSFLILRTVLRSLGSENSQPQKTALAIGLAIPIMVFGVVATVGSSPLILVADLAFGIFLRSLWKKYSFHAMLPLSSSYPVVAPSYPGSTS